MSLNNLLRNYRTCFQIKHIIEFKVSRKSKCVMSIGGSVMEYIREKVPFLENEENKIEKYWSEHISLEHTLQQADTFFNEEQYIEVYETLNQLKYSKNIEVIWRMARALFNLSFTPQISYDVTKQMIHEAYEILEKTGRKGRDKAIYHKWMAIIMDRKNGLESLEVKITGYSDIRDHLVQATIDNPRDFTVQYMLGRWHYDMANLTWLQRKIAKYLFREPPISTYLDAYKHLYKAEELNPRTYLPNIYLLACACMQLGQYYRARYYLTIALGLPANSNDEKMYVIKANNLLEKLEKYVLGMDLLQENMPLVHSFEH